MIRLGTLNNARIFAAGGGGEISGDRLPHNSLVRRTGIEETCVSYCEKILKVIPFVCLIRFQEYILIIFIFVCKFIKIILLETVQNYFTLIYQTFDDVDPHDSGGWRFDVTLHFTPVNFIFVCTIHT